MNRSMRIGFISFCLTFAPTGAAVSAVGDYSELSLEQLMRIEVTSAAKRPVSIADTPAAVFVLTNDDIRRSGARSIPAALRLVPGLHVAQLSSQSWAISARGVNSQFANKLLVMIDGRSVYTPLFSGVFWNRQDTLLEDIDRIEVIRGPGAALWGANAVNGVINIITKNARDTQGNFTFTGIGNNDQAEAAFRHGGSISDDAHYRIFGKARNFGSHELEDGSDGADDYRDGRGGFRADGILENGDTWHVQGGSFSSVAGYTSESPSVTPPHATRFNDDDTVTGSYLLGSWGRDIGPDNRVEIRSYIHREVSEGEEISEERDIVDFDADHRFKFGDLHTIVWGFGGRYSRDELSESFRYRFSEESGDQSMVHAFLQDTISLWDGDVSLTLGTKLEYNSYTGVEIQPSARAIWRATPDHNVWAAVSRAVRTPSRAERDAEISLGVFPSSTATALGLPDTGLPLDIRVIGNPDIESEELLALELGHRWTASPTVSFDTAVFYNFYDRTLTTSIGTPTLETQGTTPYLELPVNFMNDGEADLYGMEVVANWRPIDTLALQGWYSLLQGDLTGGDANYQMALRAQYDVSPTVSVDVMGRIVSELATSDIDGYGEVNARVAWRPRPNVELALTGQNLLRDERTEFTNDGFLNFSNKVERSVFGSLTVRF